MVSAILTPTQKYAAGALFGLALHKAQTHQTRPLASIFDEDEDELDGGDSRTPYSVSADPELWIHQTSGLLRPVFSFLEINDQAWPGLEETAGSPSGTHHVGAFIRLLAEDSSETSSEMKDQEHGLSNAVSSMAATMDPSEEFAYHKKKHRAYEQEWREILSSAAQPQPEVKDEDRETDEKKDNDHETDEKKVDDHETDEKKDDDRETDEQDTSGKRSIMAEPSVGSGRKCDTKPFEELTLLDDKRKVAVLFELLTACLAKTPELDNTAKRRKNDYDARHRVALRLLSTWFDIEWIKMEAIETIVASSAMAILKERNSKQQEADSSQSRWAKWRRGGIIGAAALTGGTLMAITGGLAAPAIAAGFGALAPTLGTMIPVIGASGFAAAATAAGSVAGSVAVAASFGAAGAGLSGAKMARRTGSIDEFEFKVVGENRKKGRLAVEVVISGFVFEEDDFVKPWEGQADNSERSDKAGKLLAEEVLEKGLHGQRPVTLLGFSLGARVIFRCLQCLSESDNNAGLIERVVLLGSPIAIQDENWETARKMVSGRFVNAYSTNDWTLGVAFRASILSRGVAGVQPVDVPGIENVDVTEVIEGHSSYLWATQQIIEQLELNAYFPVFNATPMKPGEDTYSGNSFLGGYIQPAGKGEGI
ncbi:uncharacterized protein LOC108193349 isoform X4 [Daucus carota subsp. sativus]|uniref:uncharacterized protein LOC108193349 isoform X4 n=1 Tax=Daucus carota subsp. sativus TaxID=79200 RepID=UPI003083E492